MINTYSLSYVKQIPIIKKWLGRESVQFITLRVRAAELANVKH